MMLIDRHGSLIREDDGCLKAAEVMTTDHTNLAGKTEERPHKVLTLAGVNEATRTETIQALGEIDRLLAKQDGAGGGTRLETTFEQLSQDESSLLDSRCGNVLSVSHLAAMQETGGELCAARSDQGHQQGHMHEVLKQLNSS